MVATEPVARPAAAVAVAAGLIGLFVLRPLAPGTGPTLGLLAVLLVVGVLWPVPAAAVESVSRRPGLVLAVGVGAFAAGRVVGALGPGLSPVPARAGYVAAVVFAAVAEEAFFRRFLYAVLAPAGAGLAIGGSAVLFALAHVPLYGWWVFPLDLAAGLVLGWQRWAGGRWTLPMATHVAANLLIVL